MATEFKYRLLDGNASWGIAIDLVADYGPVVDVAADLVEITPQLFFRNEATQKCGAREQFFLELGLRLVAKEIAGVPGARSFIVRLKNVGYRPTDYQAEGLASAIAGWAAIAFGFPALDLRGKYDQELNRYVFPFAGWRHIPPESRGAGPAELNRIATDRLKSARSLLKGHQAARAAESASDAVWSALQRLVPRQGDGSECPIIALSDMEALRKRLLASNKNISRQVERHLVRIVSWFPDVQAKAPEIQASDAEAYIDSADAIVSWAEREVANVSK